MKYLVAGLGNMGADYDGTRHNVGFEVLDLMAKGAEVTFKHETLGDIAVIRHKGRAFHLLKPSTYMNLSGKAVRYWMNKLSIPQDRILVITDDLNIPFGSVRVRPGGSDGGHNGLKHINEILGNQNYARIRVGIGADFAKGRQVDYVLGKWTKDELEKLPQILQHTGKAVFAFGTIGISETMNRFTKK
ncbi:MAG: aminoacyl-tRNA hydrolase [Saprospiraceae bacterium]|nr:aminoacyl-tRNA hydrolase [Saprospiraceae bacterium]